MADSANDSNSRPSLTAVSNADGVTIVRLWADPVTHRLLVDTGAAGAVTFVTSEVVSGSGTSWTLAATPTLGSEAIYGNGQRLTPGGVDYTISGATITTINSFVSGTVLADYRK